MSQTNGNGTPVKSENGIVITLSPELNAVLEDMTTRLLVQMNKTRDECLAKQEENLTVEQRVDKRIDEKLTNLFDNFQAKATSATKENRTVGRRQRKSVSAPVFAPVANEGQQRYNNRYQVSKLSMLKKQILLWANDKDWVTADQANAAFGSVAATSAQSHRDAIADGMRSLSRLGIMCFRKDQGYKYRVNNDYRNLVEGITLQPVQPVA
jgi:hypothetical protein